MNLVAVAILLAMLPLTVWAWRLRPGVQAKDEFVGIWKLGPWGKQVITDFYALEVMLAVWMLGLKTLVGFGRFFRGLPSSTASSAT